MANFARDQDGLREKMNQSFAPSVFQSAMEEQVRANMSFFGDAMKMFTTFGTGPLSGMKTSASAPTPTQPSSAAPAPDSDLDELKRQMAEMRNRLEDLAKK